MPRQKKSSKSSGKLKQSTLSGHISPRSQTRTKPSLPARSSKRKRLTHTSDEEGDTSDDSDVGAIKLQPRKPSEEDEAPHSPVKRRKVTVPDSDDGNSDSAPIASSSARNKKETRGGKKNSSEGSKMKSRTVQLVLSDSEPEEAPRLRRRKLVKGVRPSEPDDDEEENMSEEVEKKHILANRLRTRDKKTAFQKNLEKLKRKKQGKPIELSSEEESQDEEDEEEEDRSAPFKGAKPDSDRDSLFDDRSDDEESVGSSDFIVEDDGAGLAALPIEFSMEAHQDLVHQFKKIFQFFVHIAVRAPVERHAFMAQQMKGEEYFSVPLTVTRRKILGLRDSLVASSVWRPEFKKPLEKYPILDLIQLEYAIPGCDACHLGARLSTLTGRLIGEPYDPLGFQDKDDSDNSDSSTNVRAEFQLGRFCARRTRVYHDLTHWEYNLFKTINDEVDELHIADQKKDGAFVRVAWAGGKRPPDDLQDADAICEWLDQRKVIDVEWERLKAVMESAQHLEAAAKKGADDGD